LVKRTDGKISDLCLAMKKRGFGLGRWNGVGGKVADGENIEQATKREAKEEIGVDVGVMEKVAEIKFYFKFNPDFNQFVHVYISEDWKGEPTESEEMNPKWYTVDNIPYTLMWPDYFFWLPFVLEDKKINAEFTFGEKDIVLEQKIEETKNFLGYN
jgi:8-oxo-dGTP pyrophosphatase MutT (NUDIX family)